MNLPSTHRMNTDDSYTSEEINAMVVVMKNVDLFESFLYVITVHVSYIFNGIHSRYTLL